MTLKLKLQGLQDKLRALRPPRHLDQPAPQLRAGSPAEAGVASDAKASIDAVCHAWAEASGEPFVTLVAGRGVIITHEAFGQDAKAMEIITGKSAARLYDEHLFRPLEFGDVRMGNR